MKIEIRPTVKADAQMLSYIQRLAFWPLYEKYHDKGNPGLRGEEDILNRLNHRRFKCFTILLDDEIVGGVVYRSKGSGVFFTELGDGEYYLQRIFIKPEWQGNRIAQTAIRLCEKQFPDARMFVVDFPVDMLQNRMCYEAVGFSDTGMRKEIEPGLELAFYKKRV